MAESRANDSRPGRTALVAQGAFEPRRNAQLCMVVQDSHPRCARVEVLILQKLTRTILLAPAQRRVRHTWFKEF